MPFRDTLTGPQQVACTLAVVEQVHAIERNEPHRREGGFPVAALAKPLGAGVASAITVATFHATGVRVREQPVKIEDL